MIIKEYSFAENQQEITRRIEIVRMAHHERTKKLSQLMKSMDEQRAEIVAMLEFDWPGADEIIDTLCHFVTESIHEDGSPVVYRIVDRALESYGKAVFRPNGKKLEDPLRIAIFMDRLLCETAHELNITVEDEYGSAWNVDSEVAFSDWLDAHPGPLTVYQRRGGDDEVMKKRLYELLTCKSIKRVLKRTGYESAVVDGSLAFGR